MRDTRVGAFFFASGGTTSVFQAGVLSGAQVGSDSSTMDTSEVAFGGVYVPAEFNGDTLTFATVGPWGTTTKLTKVVATGWNYFTSDELVQIGSSPNLKISTSAGVSADATLWLELKS